MTTGKVNKYTVLSFLGGALVTALALSAVSFLGAGALIARGLNPPEQALPEPPPKPTERSISLRMLGADGPGPREQPLPAPWSTLPDHLSADPARGELAPNTTARVLVQRRDPDRIAMLDAKTGAVIWEDEVYRYDGAAACGGRLFTRGWGVLEARDAADGKVLWTHAEPRTADKQPARAFDSPTCADDLVVVVATPPLTQKQPSAPPELLAFDATTGKLRWKTPLPGRGHSQLEGKLRHRVFTPTLVIHAGGPHQPAASAFDRKTGARVWTTGEPTTGTHQATLLGALVVITNPSRSMGLDAATGATLWGQPSAGASRPPTLHHGQLLLERHDRERAYSLDPLTGRTATRARATPRPLATPLPADLRPSCAPMLLTPAPRTTP